MSGACCVDVVLEGQVAVEGRTPRPSRVTTSLGKIVAASSASNPQPGNIGDGLVIKTIFLALHSGAVPSTRIPPNCESTDCYARYLYHYHMHRGPAAAGGH